MSKFSDLAAEFLAHKRIAVAGVSRAGDQPANFIYRKLKDAGYEVFPVNPNCDQIEGDRCFEDLKAIQEALDGVVICTPPLSAEEIVRQCAELGITRVWMHRSFGAGSVSKKAVEFCRANDIAVLAGGCPMMFCQPVDIAHRCMRWFLQTSGSFRRSMQD